jgi:hypothetical protein
MPPVTSGQIEAAVGLAHDDVWAVGGQYDGALFEHWNGHVWSEVNGPKQGDPSALSAIAANDIWAVGRSDLRTPQLYHFDGSRWRLVSGPSIGVGASGKLGIAAFGADDIWISYATPKDQSGLYVIAVSHWDGATWSTTTFGKRVTSDYDTVALSGSAWNDVWVVGTVGFGTGRTFTAHFDGLRWTVVPSPNPGGYPDALSAVTTFPGGVAWAVGYASPQSGVDTLAMRFTA